MNTETKINIFIVEDNKVYTQTLKANIENTFANKKFQIHSFETGEKCMEELITVKPQLVVLDFYLNSKYPNAADGLEIIKRIKAQGQQTTIIVLSMQKNIGVLRTAIEHYDCIYVQKDQNAFSKVEQEIRKVFVREELPAPEQLN